MYDSRLGRFFAVDPLADKYPFYSPYIFSGNIVINAIDLEGLEPKVIDGELVGYLVQSKQGPLQITKDLNDSKTQEKYGYTLITKARWQDIVISNIELFKNDNGITDIGDINKGDLLSLETLINREKRVGEINKMANKLIDSNKKEIGENNNKIEILKNENADIQVQINTLERNNVLSNESQLDKPQTEDPGTCLSIGSELTQFFRNMKIAKLNSKKHINNLEIKQYYDINKILEKANEKIESNKNKVE